MVTETLKYNQILPGVLTDDRLKYIQGVFNVELGFKLMQYVQAIGGEFKISSSLLKVVPRNLGQHMISQEIYVTHLGASKL